MGEGEALKGREEREEVVVEAWMNERKVDQIGSNTDFAHILIVRVSKHQGEGEVQ